MPFPPDFLQQENFRLAHRRLIRSGDDIYKRYYRHLHSPYAVASEVTLQALRSDIRTHGYEPEAATRFFRPKSNGLLRPFTLLTYQDLVVYQAIVNTIALRFQPALSRQRDRRAFSNVFGGPESDFFFRPWRVGYSRFSAAKARAFLGGYGWVGSFDLVAFYELIDHGQLRSVLSPKVKNDDLLDLLFRCLGTWSSSTSDGTLEHGIPQGPEPSGMLAECLLNSFDRQRFPDVRYFRYSDDITVLGQGRAAVESGIRRLDLHAKRLGLVPQSEKISVEHARSVRQMLKGPSLTSAEARSIYQAPTSRKAQKVLRDMLKGAIREGNDGTRAVADITKFKFALNRLNANRYVLRRIAPLLITTQHLADDLSAYFAKYPNDTEAAELLAQTLTHEPLADAAATAYVQAYDRCAATPSTRLVSDTWRRSLERSMPLDVAVRLFRARRAGPKHAASIVSAIDHPLGKSLVWSGVMSPSNTAPSPRHLSRYRSLLDADAKQGAADLAITAVASLIEKWPATSADAWEPASDLNDAATAYCYMLGMTSAKPQASTPFARLFKTKLGVGTLPWKRAFSGDLNVIREAVINLHRLLGGDPSNKVMALDGLNQVLLFAFSKQDPKLAPSFVAAAKNGDPPIGAWIRDGHVRRRLPTAAAWMEEVHELRLWCHLSHPTHRSTGKATRRITYPEIKRTKSRLFPAMDELFREWRTIV